MQRASLALSAAFAAGAASVAAAQSTAPFVLVDNVEGSYVDTHPVPIRPMAITADELHLYAVNTHGSVVQHFDNPTGVPSQTFAVPRGPVSIALWTDPDSDEQPERLVVACRGSYALAVLDRLTGDVVHLLERRDGILAEPGDLLVDQQNHVAFLSCAAAGVVLEIDLRVPAVVRSFAIPGEDPTFLCWDAPDDTGPDLVNVLVAPLRSGNNSGARPDTGNPFNGFPATAQAGGPTVVDFATTAIGAPLPDRDLFRLVRASGLVEPVTTAMGTIQFACGVNPATGAVWQLNTEALNKDPTKQSEAAIQGDFVRNRVSIASLPPIGGAPNPPTLVVDLDMTNPALPFDPTRTVGQPYALGWAPGGFAFVAGLLTDNVMLLDSAGGFVLEWNVTDGAIPRAVLYSPLLNLAFVYCWGTNAIEAYLVTTGMPLSFTLDLGHDPTPASVRDGRTVFYDAQHSLHNNASCASCHVDGRTDMLAWDLSDLPFDGKGPMVTQTLAGIERMVNFHWRGEQQMNLADFNAAFVNLLGASGQLSAAQFVAFQDFVFSLQNPANPLGNVDRLVDNAVYAPLATSTFQPNAVQGQASFIPADGGSCERCHSLPLGSNNDIVADGAGFGEQNPRRQFFKISPFHELYRKEQDANPLTGLIDLVPITLPALSGVGTELLFVPLGGTGLAHAGVVPGLHAFLAFFFGGNTQFAADVTAFVHQWDQGLAPSVHRAVLLNQQTLAADPTLAAVVQTYFVNQATQQAGASHRNCDVAAFGTSTLNGVLTPMRWVFRAGQFWPEDTTQAPRPPSFFVTQAQNGEGSNVFLGLPAGMGERFAVDYDGDDLFNADELAAGLDPFDPDSDGDGFLDGHPNDATPPVVTRAVTQFVTGKVARINIETNEPTTVRISYTEGVTSRSKGSTVLGKSHSILLNDLLPSTGGSPWFTYNGTITAFDFAGNQSPGQGLPNMPLFNQQLNPPPPLPITTRSFIDGPATAVIGRLRWGPIARTIPPGGLSATPTVRVNRKTGGPPPLPKAGHVVIARIFRNGVLDGSFTPVAGARKVTGFDFGSGPTPFPGLVGPFLVSTTTNATGDANLGFSLGGLAAGDQVTLNVELVAIEVVGPVNFTIGSSSLWSMPDTPAILRRIDLTY